MQRQQRLHEQQVRVHVCGRVHDKGMQAKIISCRQTERKELGQCDQLTGSYTEQFLVDTAKAWLEEAALCNHVVICATIDIDYFASVNELYGHPVGDQILVHLANVCEELLQGEHAFVARLGDDEFAVFWRYCSFEGGIDQAINLFTHIQESAFIWEDEVIPLSVSMGIAHNELGAINKFEELFDLAQRGTKAV